MSESSTEASVADVLAGKPAGEHIDRRESGVDLADVVGNRDGRPMPLEDGSRVLVRFACPRELEPCVVEAEVESAAAREERADIHTASVASSESCPSAAAMLRQAVSK